MSDGNSASQGAKMKLGIISIVLAVLGFLVPWLLLFVQSRIFHSYFIPAILVLLSGVILAVAGIAVGILAVVKRQWIGAVGIVLGACKIIAVLLHFIRR